MAGSELATGSDRQEWRSWIRVPAGNLAGRARGVCRGSTTVSAHRAVHIVQW